MRSVAFLNSADADHARQLLLLVHGRAVAAELERYRRVIAAYVEHVEDGEKFDALRRLVDADVRTS